MFSGKDSSHRNDGELLKVVQRTLDKCGDVDTAHLQLDVRDGCVVLEGSVDMFWKRSCAEYLAARVPGVSGVENHLVVVPRDSFSDQTIAERIAASILHEATMDVADVHIKVQDGVVTLTGRIPDEALRDQLESPMQQLAGVVGIVDHLEVGTTGRATTPS